MVSFDSSIYEYIEEFMGDDLIYALMATLLEFKNSGRYLPAEGEKQDRGQGYYWWIIHHHSMCLYIERPDAYILGIVDGEVRGKEGIEYYLEKFISNL